MSAVTASLCSALMFVLVFVSASADKKIITAESGQDVTLTCRAPVKNNKITVVQWSRADLEDQNVFVDRDGHFVPDDQHPSFKNRVDLQDRQMKDGDVSLILKNVTINDTGTYECRVIMEEKRLLKISIINLSVVDPPGQTGGQEKDGGKEEGGPVGLIVVTFSLLVLVLAVAVSFVRLITKQHFKTLDPESTQRLYALQMDSYSNDLKMN